MSIFGLREDDGQRESIPCPYCDARAGRIRETLKMEERDGTVYIVKNCRCGECGETFYAVASFDPGDSWMYCRREDLEPRTGIRIRRGRRWP